MEFQVKYESQASENACGPTCLNMLGYDGYSLISKREVQSGTSIDLVSRIPGARKCCHYSNDKKFAYALPHMLSLFFPWNIKQGHWVIRHRDKIYCPTFGVKPASSYLEGVLQVAGEFMVPFNGQVVSAEDLKKESEKEEEMIGREFLLDGRRVKFLGFYDPFQGVEFAPGVSKSVGCRGFRVLYLDNPNNSWEPKKGEEKTPPLNMIGNLIRT